MPGRTGRPDPDLVVACVGGGSTRPAPFRVSWTRRPGWSGWKQPGGRPSAGVSRACCTACTRTCSRTSGGRSSRPSPFPPASTIRGSVPNTPTCPSWAGRRYYTATDGEVLDALQLLARTEGIIPALEPAHALAWLVRAVRAGEVAQGRPCWSPCPAGATRTPSRSCGSWRDGRAGGGERAGRRGRGSTAGRPGRGAASSWSPT